MISSFDELLNAAKQQDVKQRLLMLFANAQSESKKHKSTQRGNVDPVMCVDKLPADISSFEALVKEADTIEKEWNFILITSLDGDKNTPPTTEAAEPYLNQMTNDLTSGQGMSKYAVFDRDGNTVALQAS